MAFWHNLYLEVQNFINKHYAALKTSKIFTYKPNEITRSHFKNLYVQYEIDISLQE